MISCSYKAGKCVAWPACETEERSGLAAIRGVKPTELCWNYKQQRDRSSETNRLGQRNKGDSMRYKLCPGGRVNVDEEEEWIGQ
jgi:hypothetical protein